MAATKGNRWWEVRSSHGRKPIFASPDELAEACQEYFEWNENNPMLKSELVTFQGESHLEEVPVMRAMTLTALTRFLDVTSDTWDNYKKREDFLGVCKAAEQTIREQKFTGAAGGFLNSMIIARDLGLKDASVNEHTGKDGGPMTSIIVGTQTAEDAAAAYSQLMEGND